MGRAPCCDKSKVKRGPWSPEEDIKLKEFIEKYGTGGNWIALPQKVGLKRCGKSCRLRWLNYLRPNIKHGDFSEEEDRIICTLFATIGSRWSIIAAQLPGRTDNDIKNYWNTKLKKKLLGIPPSQRKSSQQQTKQQEHQEQQLIYPSSNADHIINAMLPTTSPSSSSFQSLIFNTHNAHYGQYQMKEETLMGFENNNYMYGGLTFGDTHNNNLHGDNCMGDHQEASLRACGNYGEIQDPNGTNIISFSTQESDMYSAYNYNSMP